MANRYIVWRHHVVQGTFTFAELKKWLALRIPEYKERIEAAKFVKQLDHIALNLTDYCLIRVVKEDTIMRERVN